MHKAVIAALCLISASALGQGVRYDNRVTTVATNVPSNASAPVLAMPNASVLICTDGTCVTKASLFSNQGLTTITANPLKTDAQGRFGFWAASGSYFYQVKDFQGNVIGTYPFTLGGSGSGGATLPSTPSIVKSVTALTSTPAVASDVVGLFGTCGSSQVLAGNGTCVNNGSAAVGQQFRIAGYTGSGSGPTTQLGQTNATTDSTGNPLTVPGALTANQTNGVANTDTAGGVTAFQSDANCTNSHCAGAIPPASTDSNYKLPLNTTSTNTTNSIDDYRNNTVGHFGVNPPASLNTAGNITGNQIYSIEGVNFTKPSPTPNLGAIQIGHQQVLTYSQPCFSNGIFSPTLFAPPAGYTNVSDWCVMQGNNAFMTSYGNGIHQMYGSAFFNYAGNGDAQQFNDFDFFSGGYTAPSDEGEKWGGVHQNTVQDTIGTLTAVADSKHITIGGFSQGDNTYGQGRLVLDQTAAYITQTFADGNVDPTNDGLTPGKLTLNHVTLPVSTGIGTVGTAGCLVPAQTNGEALATCVLNVVGTNAFGTTASKGIASAANSSANLENLGINITAASALSAGQQTVTMSLHKSLPGGAFICQGGVAGSAVELRSDSLNVSVQGQQVTGRAVPVFCSPDAHTIEYSFPNSSQLNASLYAGNTNSRTTAISGSGTGSGAFGVDLTRTGNVVTGHVLQGNTTGYQYTLAGDKFFTVEGCTNYNVSALVGPISLVNTDSTGSTFTYPQTGSDAAICTTGKLIPQNTSIALYPAAEIYDVSDPVTGALSASLITSPQPLFASGHSFKIPTNSSAAVGGIAMQQQIAQPTFSSSSYHVDLLENTAVGSTAFSALVAQPFDSQAIGSGGHVPPSNLLEGTGQFSYGLVLNTAPYRGGSVIGIGFPSCGDADAESCPLFLHYNIELAEGGTVVRSFDEPTQTFQQTIGNTPVWTQGPTAAQWFTSTIHKNAQFIGGDPNTGQNVPETQMRNLSGIGNGGGLPAYDNVLPTPTGTVLTAGPSQNIYVIRVNFPHGQSYTPPLFLFSTATTPNNTISCSVVPAGLTGTVYAFTNPNFYPVGACPNNTTVVTDTGTRVTPIPANAPSFGADFLSGAHVASSLGGFLFAPVELGQPGSTSVGYTTQSAGFSQRTTDGVISVDTTTLGNGLGELDAAAMKVAGSPVCTTATGCGGTSGVSSIDTLTGAFTFTGPGVSHVGNAYTFSGTGAGIGSVGLTAPSWLAVSGSPLTSSGTLGLSAATGQAAHQVIGTCGAGTSFGPCSLVAGDIPALAYIPTASPSTGVQLALSSTNTGGTQETLASTGGDSFIFGSAGSGGSLGNPSNSWYVRDTTAGINMFVLTATAQYFNGPLIVNGLQALTGSAAGVSGQCVQYTGTYTTGPSGAGCGGGGGISGLTTGFIPKASSATAIANSLLDDSVTTANTLTYSGTGGMSVASVATTGVAGVGGGSVLTEGTATAGAAGFDTFWADSTAHRLKVNNNNGGATNIPTVATAGTSGNLVNYASNGIDLGVGVAAPAGTVVGTTDTQTLTNKTIDGVTPATMAFLDATSSIQTQLNGKQATLLAKVTTTVGTTAIAANACATAVTVTMTGLATTNTLNFTPTADVATVTGWGATGGLTIDAWPTANTVNYKVCNQTAASITPGASVTFNVSAQ